MICEWDCGSTLKGCNHEPLCFEIREVESHIAALRQEFPRGQTSNMQKTHNAPDVKVTWPNERYQVDGEGRKEK
jgi:hypothetical protein